MLLDMKATFERLVKNHGEVTFHKIVKVNEIFTDTDGDLAITYFYEIVKLKNLIEKYAGEKVFQDEYQTENFRLSAKNLDFIKSTYEFYQSLVYRLHQISQEIHRREFGEYSKLPLIPITFSLEEYEKKLTLGIIPNYQDESKLNEEKENKPAKRLNLSPNKKEILHSKIIEEVNNFIEAGKGTLEQAFQKLSKRSKRLFGYELTPKQIEGRYSRNKKKHF